MILRLPMFEARHESRDQFKAVKAKTIDKCTAVVVFDRCSSLSGLWDSYITCLAHPKPSPSREVPQSVAEARVRDIFAFPCGHSKVSPNFAGMHLCGDVEDCYKVEFARNFLLSLSPCADLRFATLSLSNWRFIFPLELNRHPDPSRGDKNLSVLDKHMALSASNLVGLLFCDMKFDFGPTDAV